MKTRIRILSACFAASALVAASVVPVSAQAVSVQTFTSPGADSSPLQSANCNTGTLQISGSGTWTVVPQGSNDGGATYFTIPTIGGGSITTAGTFSGALAGYASSLFRFNVTAVSGSVSIVKNCSAQQIPSSGGSGGGGTTPIPVAAQTPIPVVAQTALPVAAQTPIPVSTSAVTVTIASQAPLTVAAQTPLPVAAQTPLPVSTASVTVSIASQAPLTVAAQTPIPVAAQTPLPVQATSVAVAATTLQVATQTAIPVASQTALPVASQTALPVASTSVPVSYPTGGVPLANPSAPLPVVISSPLPAGSNPLGSIIVSAGPANQNVTVLNATAAPTSIPAGTNSIGSVGLNAGANAIGSITNTSFALSSGSATIGSIANTSFGIGTGIGSTSGNPLYVSGGTGGGSTSYPYTTGSAQAASGSNSVAGIACVYSTTTPTLSSGNPVQPILCDVAGNMLVNVVTPVTIANPVPTSAAGTSATSLITIQGSAAGVTVPISGTINAIGVATSGNNATVITNNGSLAANTATTTYSYGNGLKNLSWFIKGTNGATAGTISIMCTGTSGGAYVAVTPQNAPATISVGASATVDTQIAVQPCRATYLISTTALTAASADVQGAY